MAEEEKSIHDLTAIATSRPFLSLPEPCSYRPKAVDFQRSIATSHYRFFYSQLLSRMSPGKRNEATPRKVCLRKERTDLTTLPEAKREDPLQCTNVRIERV